MNEGWVQALEPIHRSFLLQVELVPQLVSTCPSLL
jgi:hypothetical protein